jgi:hypothetical protein
MIFMAIVHPFKDKCTIVVVGTIWFFDPPQRFYLSSYIIFGDKFIWCALL